MATESDWHNKVTEHGVKISNLKESDVNQWAAINRIRNRLPYWTTLLIAVLMGVIGFLAKGVMKEVGG